MSGRAAALSLTVSLYLAIPSARSKIQFVPSQRERERGRPRIKPMPTPPRTPLRKGPARNSHTHAHARTRTYTSAQSHYKLTTLGLLSSTSDGFNTLVTYLREFRMRAPLAPAAAVAVMGIDVLSRFGAAAAAAAAASRRKSARARAYRPAAIGARRVNFI